jgi:putative transposase
MPWRETRVMDERARFVLAVEAREEPMAAVCRRFGISRDKGYKWLRRWQADGFAGLADQPRAPRSHPQAATEELLEACLALRRQHPTWGPAKVKAALERRSPAGLSGRPWPAASTIGACFDREGLTVRRRPRRRAPPGGPLFAADAANDVWTIDFKGWFRTGDGTRIDPLTLSDATSRYPARAARR